MAGGLAVTKKGQAADRLTKPAWVPGLLAPLIAGRKRTLALSDANSNRYSTRQ